MHGKPKRRNKAAFSHFSGVVWTLPANAALLRRCKGTEFLSFNDGLGYMQIRVDCTKDNFRLVTKDEGKT